MPNGLLATTVALVHRTRKQKKMTLFKIYNGTGLRPKWVRDLIYGRKQRPDVHRVQLLHDFLQSSLKPNGGRHYVRKNSK